MMMSSSPSTTGATKRPGQYVGLYSITGESFGEAQLDLFLETPEQDYYEDAFHASLADNDQLT